MTPARPPSPGCGVGTRHAGRSRALGVTRRYPRQATTEPDRRPAAAFVAAFPKEVMTVFVLPVLLVLFLLPLALAVVVVAASAQPQPQRVVRRPRDEP